MATTETLYPSGYGDDLRTIDDLMATHCRDEYTEPEYKRRLRNWLISKKGLVGIGDILPRGASTVSDASATGRSFHQLQRFADGTDWACAVDLVVKTATTHSSGMVPWDEVPEQGSDDAEDWGVHINVSNEPWHMQPIEIDGHTRWVNAGRKRPVEGYPIPNVGDVTPAPEPEPEPEPAPEPGVKPTLHNKPLRQQTANERHYTRYLQQVLVDHCGQILDVDGWFGNDTERGVRNIQKWFDLEVDGWVGPKTWALVDAIVYWRT